MLSDPVLIEGLDGARRSLERTESKPGDEKDEAWLQDLIFRMPELLPVHEFDRGISSLIPVGREVGTPRGPIDVLYLTPEGRVVIVETKLWKNPEHHRTVVAQILDYAKELSRWDYDDVRSAVNQALRSSGGENPETLESTVESYLSEVGRGMDEFQELIIENLRTGRFLLLIVGDRISANVSLLTEAIQGSPGLEFQFGLVELHFHRLNEDSDWPLVVVPDVVGRTVEETRAIVKLSFEREKPRVEVSVPQEESTGRSKSKVTLESFTTQLPEDFQPVFHQWSTRWLSSGFTFSFGTTGMGLRVTTAGKERSIADIYPDCVSVIREKDTETYKPVPAQFQEYTNTIRGIPVVAQKLMENRRYVYHEKMTADELRSILDATLVFAEKVGDK